MEPMMSQSEFKALLMPIIQEEFQIEYQGFAEISDDIFSDIYEGKADQIINEKPEEEPGAELQFGAVEAMHTATILVPVWELSKLTAEVYTHIRKHQLGREVSADSISRTELEDALSHQLARHVGGKRAKKVANAVMESLIAR